MKILVIGLDGVSSELLFSDARLENLRRLMELGCYGKLSYQITPDRMNLWMSLAAGKNVGQLGESGTEDIEAVQNIAIWNQLEEQNKSVIVVGLPPFISYPIEIEALIDDSLIELRSQGEELTVREESLLKDHIYTASQKQLDLVRSLMQSEEWNYFQFIDDGLFQLQKSEIGQRRSSAQGLIADYYLYLNDEIGKILELLDDSTIVLLVSMHTTESFDGSFILASSNNPLAGEVEGANLLDMAPTVLELSGYEITADMEGKSLVAGKMLEAGSDIDLSAEEEEILREQLSGLGYIS